MDNINIFQNITSNYYIQSDQYASNYLNQNEASLMKLVFSKFINDTTYTETNKEFINYFLKTNNISYYTMENFIDNIYYYDDTMSLLQKNKNSFQYGYNYFSDSSATESLVYKDSEAATHPDTNLNIIDFDVSSFASGAIINYLFYLDIIYQIYDKTLQYKMQSLDVKTNQYIIKCRYTLGTGTQNLIFSQIPYNINLNLTRGNNNTVLNVEVSDKNVEAIFNIFKQDLLKHLNYISGDQIKNTDLNFLKSLKDFYLLCRLKLQYLIIQSVHLLSTQANLNTLNNNIQYFMSQSVLPVFYNFQLKILQYSQNISDKNLIFNTQVLDKTQQLQLINQSLAKYKDRLKKEKSSVEQKNTFIRNDSSFDLIAKIIFILTILISFIIALLDLPASTKTIIFFVIIVIIVLLKIIIFSFTYQRYYENFDTANLDMLAKYPKLSMTSYNQINPDGIQVTVAASSEQSNGSAFQMFNSDITNSWTTNLNTYKDGNAVNTLRTDYAGEYVKIDFGEKIILKNYTIQLSNSKQGPKNFRIYASDNNISWGNINDSSWILLDKQDEIVYDTSSLAKTFEIPSNNTTYRYYIIIVNQLNGNDQSVLSINKINFYAVAPIKKYPEFPAISNTYNYYDNSVPIRIAASSSKDTAFYPFTNILRNSWNSGANTYYNGNALQTYKTDYPGEYLKIDLGQSIILKNYILRISLLNQGPTSFRLYGTDDNRGWNDINFSDWRLIDEQTDQTFDLSMKKSYDITNNGYSKFPYRYFMLIVKNVQNTTTSVNIGKLELYGSFVKSAPTIEKQQLILQNQSEQEVTLQNKYKIIQILDYQIFYNLNSYIDGMNYDIIIPSLEKEYSNFDQLNKKVIAYSSLTNKNVNIKNLDGYNVNAELNLFMNLALLIGILFTIYYFTNFVIALVLGFIGLFLVIVIFWIETTRRVRTKAKNTYWSPPNDTNITRMST